MRPDGRWMFRLMVIATLGVAAGAGDRPKVEFVEMDGQRCLQPVLHERPVELSDYRAAALRWLQRDRPGAPTPEWKTEIVLDPSSSAESGPAGPFVRRETVSLDGIVGPGATVCFDINLQDRQPAVDAPSSMSTPNRWAESTRGILAQHCGQCHLPNLPTSVPRALAVFNLTEEPWYGRLTHDQLDSLRRRVGAIHEFPEADRSIVERFVGCARDQACQ